MKRGILVVILIVILSSFVSAGIFTGIWGEFLTGRQISNITTCTDSDGGIDYFVKGSATMIGQGTLTDNCVSETKLAEATCYLPGQSAGNWGYVYYDCNKCVNGVCINNSICKDGTPFGKCSVNKPVYCYPNGGLGDRCDLCGCNVGFKCDTRLNISCIETCSTTEECKKYEWGGIKRICSDGMCIPCYGIYQEMGLCGGENITYGEPNYTSNPINQIMECWKDEDCKTVCPQRTTSYYCDEKANWCYCTIGSQIIVNGTKLLDFCKEISQEIHKDTTWAIDITPENVYYKIFLGEGKSIPISGNYDFHSACSAYLNMNIYKQQTYEKKLDILSLKYNFNIGEPIAFLLFGFGNIETIVPIQTTCEAVIIAGKSGITYNLSQGSSVFVDGKTITYLALGHEGAIDISVDKVGGFILSGNTETINGIEITNIKAYCGEETTTTPIPGEEIEIPSIPIPGEGCIGCLINNNCIPYGTRVSGMYCDIYSKQLSNQTEIDGSCENSYECRSNECSNSKCISTYSLLERILDFLKKFFK